MRHERMDGWMDGSGVYLLDLFSMHIRCGITCIRRRGGGENTLSKLTLT
jgi:hypothetical protein